MEAVCLNRNPSTLSQHSLEFERPRSSSPQSHVSAISRKPTMPALPAAQQLQAKLFPVLIFEHESHSQLLVQTFAKITRDDLLKTIRNAPSTQFSNRAAHISARDIHALDPSVNLHGPSFFIRKNAILVNLDPFKAVIVPDKMYVLLSKRPTEESNKPGALAARAQSILPHSAIHDFSFQGGSQTEMDLGHQVPEGYGPLLLSQDLFDIFSHIILEYDNNAFEINALETLLCAYSEFINSQYIELQAIVVTLGDELLPHNKPAMHHGKMLDRLRAARNLLGKQIGNASAAISALDEVLSSPAEMTMMNLSLKRDTVPQALMSPGTHKGHGVVHAKFEMQDYEDIEFLFDTYLQAMETTLVKLQDLRNDVDALHDIKMLNLDQTRNTLMRVEIVLSLITTIAGIGAMVAGIFGMNLLSDVEGEPYWFWTVAGILLGMLVGLSIALVAWFWHKGLLLS